MPPPELLLYYLLGVLGCWALFTLLLKKPAEAAVVAIFWPITFPLVGVIVLVSFLYRVFFG